MIWLEDKLFSAFGRAEAPVIHLPTLPAGQSIILASGTIPNRKGHPIVQRWIGAVFHNGKLHETLDLPGVLASTSFDYTQFPNPWIKDTKETEDSSDIRIAALFTSSR